MARKLSEDVKTRFKAFCLETINDPDMSGNFSLGCFPDFQAEGPNGEPLWEFHAANYNPPRTYDINELFQSVQPDIEIETHGYDDFYAIKIPKIQQRLRSAGHMPVLFTSDPTGDVFEFGTHEELQNELEEQRQAGKDVELTTADELLKRLDFTAYEDNEPTVKL